MIEKNDLKRVKKVALKKALSGIVEVERSSKKRKRMLS